MRLVRCGATANPQIFGMHIHYICECRVRKCVCVCDCAGALFYVREPADQPATHTRHPALVADPDVGNLS
jgi:hypothetical protein